MRTLPSAGSAFVQIVVVVPLERAGRDEVEALRRASGRSVNSERTPPFLRQHVAEVDAADRLRDAVGHQRSRARPRRPGPVT